jgi:hypothetical protein
MSEFTSEEDMHYLQIAAQAQKLRAGGLSVFADQAPEAPQQDFREVTELSVKLGVGGSFESVGRRTYLLAFETPAPDSDTYDAVASTAERASVAALLGRIDSGWTEITANNQLRRYIGLHADSDDDFQLIMRSLPSRVATIDGEVLARIVFGQRLVVAPTKAGDSEFRPERGEAGSPVVVSASELHGLSVVIDEISDSRDRLARGWYDVREHDTHTNLIRDRWNRRQTYTDVRKLLEDSGWTVGESNAFVTLFTRGDEVGRLIRANLAFINESDGTATLEHSAQAYSPFDLQVGTTKHSGGANGRKLTLATPERAAQWLVDQRLVAVDLQVFKARGEPPLVNSQQKTTDVQMAFLEHIVDARSHMDAATPLAFNRTVNHEPDAIISIGSTGEVTRWGAATAESLLIAAAQYADLKMDKDGVEVVSLYKHSIPPAITRAVMNALLSPGALNEVEHLATEPIVTPQGQVVSAHGYDLDAQAYISLPFRDRGRWKRDYHVPANPTLEQVQTAFEFVDEELFSDFPFEGPKDRARAFSYLLTCVGRGLINGSIGFFFNAPARGSGKSLMALLGRLLGQGSPNSVGFYFGLSQDQETQKGMCSLLVEGGRHFHADEVAFGSTLESKIITAAITGIDGDDKIRILGGNEVVKRSNLIITGCGSNVEYGTDFNRRILGITIVVPPGVRVVGRSGFRHKNIIGYINQNRPALLAALHTILLYSLQNEPAHEINSMAMNHNWAERILGAMSHISTAPDQTLAQMAISDWLDEVETGDANSIAWGELLAHLWLKANGQLKTAAEFVQLAQTHAKGEKKPELPTNLVGTLRADNAGSKWAKEFKQINRTPIPFDGSTFTLMRSDKKRDNTIQYELVCYTGDKLILAGRERHPAPVIDPEFS